ncbi:MAG: hypothetical protein V1858_01940 [Candidatus Gottesmanbacteria bacterium]
MRKLIFIGVWFIGSCLTLILSLTLLYLVDNVETKKIYLSSQSNKIISDSQYQFYAALPQVLGTFSTSVEAADARPELIRQYLNKYKSPLIPYSDLIVNLSDQYSLDFRLIVSIAQCESNLCKRIPTGSYNCWGFGNGETRFLSWEQALERVAQTLKEDYIDMGLVTPDLIMPKYVPPSVAKGGPWARCVNQFMGELQ